MKNRCVMSVAMFVVSTVHGMEVALPIATPRRSITILKRPSMETEKKDNKRADILIDRKQTTFSKIPNFDRVAIVCPILKPLRGNFPAITDFLSKVGFNKSGDRVFVRNVITFLAELHEMSTGSLAMYLDTPASKQYKLMGDHLLHISTPQHFDGDQIQAMFSRGADVNYGTHYFGNSPLMGAVFHNNRSLVEYFLKKGANTQSRNCQNRIARDFNLIHDVHRLKRLECIIACYKARFQCFNPYMRVTKLVAQALHDLPESEMVRKALYIDKILEDSCDALSQNRKAENGIPYSVTSFMEIFPAKRSLILFLSDIFNRDLKRCAASIPKSMCEYLQM